MDHFLGPPGDSSVGTGLLSSISALVGYMSALNRQIYNEILALLLTMYIDLDKLLSSRNPLFFAL